MFVGSRLNLNQYNALKDSKIGDKIAVIEYWDDSCNNIIGHNIHLQYGDFIIKTIVLNQLQNSKSNLPSYDIRSIYKDEPSYYDAEYQSIELEIIDINKPKNEITDPERCDYYGMEEYSLYNRIVQSSSKYGFL